MITELTKKQEEMLKIFENSDYRWIINVGGKGSGKTNFAIYLILKILFDERYKGSRVLLAREALRDLRNTLIVGLDRKLRDTPSLRSSIMHNSNLQLIANTYNEVEIYYLSLSEKNQQYRSILSYEFNIVIIDEADRISEGAFYEVSERFRLLHPFQRGMLILNPCSKEHWIYKTFVEKLREDIVILKSITYDNFLYVALDGDFLKQCKKYESQGRVYFVKDNVRYEPVKQQGDFVLAKKYNVSHGFLVEMENKPLAYKKVMLYGDWGVYDYGEGLFDDVFDEDNIIDRDFSLYDLSLDFTLYCGLDFGVRHNAYCLVGVDVFGNFYILDDMITTNVPVRSFIEMMLERFKEKFQLKRPQYITFVGDISGKNRELYDGYDLFTKIKNEYNLNLYGSKVRIMESIALLKDLIHQKKLLVSDKAVFSLEGFLGKFQSDGFGRPVKDGFYDHLLDAIRYVVNFAYKDKSAKQVKTIEVPKISWVYMQ